MSIRRAFILHFIYSFCTLMYQLCIMVCVQEGEGMGFLAS